MKKSFFTIDDLFKVVSGKTANLNELSAGKTPFVSATEKNNGVSAYIDDKPTFDGNLITVSRNGSVCEAFYQPIPFCASLDDIRVLTPRNFQLNKYIALYLCSIIKKEKFRYTYGRKFGTTRIKTSKILLPATNKNEPDWKAIEGFIKNTVLSQNSVFKKVVENQFDISPIFNKKVNLDTTKWKTFKYGGKDGVFIIRNGYYNKKPEHSKSGNIPFIGSTEYNNGVTEFYCLEDIQNNHKDERSTEHTLKQKIFTGNCVTVSNNGSVGNAFYQERDFTCSHDINVLYLKDGEWNKYIAMFICSVIKLEKYRWNYGRKWRPMRMPDSDIKLPVKANGRPDFEYMEKYIKCLNYSNSI